MGGVSAGEQEVSGGHLRMYPPLIIIISRWSTTCEDGWLETTPSWLEAPPHTAL